MKCHSGPPDSKDKAEEEGSVGGSGEGKSRPGNLFITTVEQGEEAGLGLGLNVFKKVFRYYGVV